MRFVSDPPSPQTMNTCAEAGEGMRPPVNTRAVERRAMWSCREIALGGKAGSSRVRAEVSEGRRSVKHGGTPSSGEVRVGLSSGPRLTRAGDDVMLDRVRLPTALFQQVCQE